MRPAAQRLLVAAAAAALFGCARITAPDLLASARARLQGGHVVAAVIDLKSALQLQPDHPEARLMLGLALLEQGLPTQALIELEKAAALRVPEAQVAPPTARAMLALGQTPQVVDRFSRTRLPDEQAAADLLATVAAAYAAQGLRTPAEATLQQALRLSPQHHAALLLQVRLLAASGDIDGAQGHLDHLLTLAPQNPHAWQLRADLLARQGAPVPATTQAYRRAIVLRPDQAPAHAGLLRCCCAKAICPAPGSRLTRCAQRGRQTR